jgi:hypothetical protein
MKLWLKWSWNSDLTVALDCAFDDYQDTTFLEVLETLSTEVAQWTNVHFELSSYSINVFSALFKGHKHIQHIHLYLTMDEDLVMQAVDTINSIQSLKGLIWRGQNLHPIPTFFFFLKPFHLQCPAFVSLHVVW